MMPSKSLFWFIFPYTLLLAAGAAAIIFFFSSRGQNKLFYDQTRSQLQIAAELFLESIKNEYTAEQFQAIHTKAQQLGAQANMRFTVILPSGVVIADSSGRLAELDNHKTRAEIAEALEGRVGSATRFSVSVEKNLMYVAVPVLDSRGKVTGVVRSSMDADLLSRRLEAVTGRNLFVLLVVIAVAGLAAWYRTKRLAGALKTLATKVDKIVSGEFTAHLDTKAELPAEVNDLAGSVREIARLYDSSLLQIFKKENELDEILKNMSEGVIAVDSQERVTHLNHAAAEILNVSSNQAKGLTVLEFIRLPVLEKFMRQTLSSGKTGEREIIINQGASNEKVFIARSSLVMGNVGQKMGAVFVLLDITDLRRLEKHRQEFVSNVSHELRTPLTTIKGFAETLQSPNFSSIPEVQKYSAIIQKHADRLSALVEDLLQLSKIEKAQRTGLVNMESVNINDVIVTALETCQVKADEHNISLETKKSSELRVKGTATLLEQALINLLDNAIKYSPSGSKVEISVQAIDGQLELSVIDHGLGVPEQSLSRLFERFYRVDPGRSREMGGTGLGLAIVKHIAHIHGGEVRVKSKVGEGSVFTLRIPLEPDQIPNPA